jgi:hypothetical protein
MRATRNVRAAMAIAALTLGLVACGRDALESAAGVDDVASLGTEPDTTTDDTGTTDNTETTGDDSDGAPIDPDDAFLEYSECMRDHGIDMPDPVMVSADGNAGPIGAGGTTSGKVIEIDNEFDPASDEFSEANEACGSILDDVMGDIEIDPEQEAAMREQMLEYAECMREQGIDYPDPQFNEGGGVTMSAGAIDMDMEEFEAANEVCGEALGMGGFSVSVTPAEAVGG